MLVQIIIFLVRKRLGLKKYEEFQFANQVNKTEYYFFDQTCIRKIVPNWGIRAAGVSLNWLVNPRCKIVKRGTFYVCD